MTHIKKIFPKVNKTTFDLFTLQTNEEDINFDHIIKIENLRIEVQNLNKLYGSNFPHLKKNLNVRLKMKKKNSKNIKYPTSKFKEYQDHIPKEYDPFYDVSTITLVNEIYQSDLENFKYNKKQ